MSVCTFLAADCVLSEKMQPEYETFIEFDTEKGTVYDGDRDDNYSLLNFEDVSSYTDLQHGVIIEWNYCTIGRANEIIEYIKSALAECDRVELWTVWLMDYYEYNERPHYKTRDIALEELNAKDIMDISEVYVWGNSKDRPTYYCLAVRR